MLFIYPNLVRTEILQTIEQTDYIDKSYKKTEELENSANQQINTYGNKAKETTYKPVDYYRNQPTFYRGLFWMAVGLLVVLWIVSGS